MLIIQVLPVIMNIEGTAGNRKTQNKSIKLFFLFIYFNSIITMDALGIRHNQSANLYKNLSTAFFYLYLIEEKFFNSLTHAQIHDLY